MAKNLIWLASYPKSGNTWVRLFLLSYLQDGKKSFGFGDLAKFISSEASNKLFLNTGLKEPMDIKDIYKNRCEVHRTISNNTPKFRILKTHLAKYKYMNFKTINEDVTFKSIYIVRNPFDVCISMASFFKISIDDAISGLLDHNAYLDFDNDQVHQFLGSWELHIKSWAMAKDSPVLIVRYEDMHTDSESTFRKILNFLEIEIKQQQLLDTISTVSFEKMSNKEDIEGFPERPSSTTKFFRKGTPFQFRDIMSQSQMLRLQKPLAPILSSLYPNL